MRNPKISILTPTKNRDRYLMEAGEAILSQNYDNWEWIIVDGSDEPGVVPRHSQVIYVYAPGSSIPVALNHALAISSGQILHWANDDDIMSDGSLRFVAESLPDDSCWMYGSILVETYDPRGNLKDETLLKAWDWKPGLIFEVNYCPQPSVYWTMDAARLVGIFDPLSGIACDYDYWCRLAKVGTPWVANRIMARYRQHPNSLSVCSSLAQRAMHDLVKAKHANSQCIITKIN